MNNDSLEREPFIEPFIKHVIALGPYGHLGDDKEMLKGEFGSLSYKSSPKQEVIAWVVENARPYYIESARNVGHSWGDDHLETDCDIAMDDLAGMLEGILEDEFSYQLSEAEAKRLIDDNNLAITPAVLCSDGFRLYLFAVYVTEQAWGWAITDIEHMKEYLASRKQRILAGSLKLAASNASNRSLNQLKCFRLRAGDAGAAPLRLIQGSRATE